jgi:hypothetical protein
MRFPLVMNNMINNSWCTLMAQAEIIEGEIPRLRRVPCSKLLFQELCNAQAPGAQYDAHIRAKFANVVPFVPAFQKVMTRFLIDGEPKLREIFLATFRDCKAGALDFLDLAPESEFGLAEQRLLTEQEARAPKPTAPLKSAVESEGAAGSAEAPPAAVGAGAPVEQTPEKTAADMKQEEKQKEAAAEEKRLQDAIQADVRSQMDSLIIYAAPPFESETALAPFKQESPGRVWVMPSPKTSRGRPASAVKVSRLHTMLRGKTQFQFLFYKAAVCLSHCIDLNFPTDSHLWTRVSHSSKIHRAARVTKKHDLMTKNSVTASGKPPKCSPRSMETLLGLAWCDLQMLFSLAWGMTQLWRRLSKAKLQAPTLSCRSLCGVL